MIMIRIMMFKIARVDEVVGSRVVFLVCHMGNSIITYTDDLSAYSILVMLLIVPRNR